MNTNATAQMVTSGGKGCMKQRLDTDQIAAEARYAMYLEACFNAAIEKATEELQRESEQQKDQIAAEAKRAIALTVSALAAPEIDERVETIVKAAIEKAWQDGYVEGSNYQIDISRAAHARKEGDASCPAKQCPNTDTTPQGSNAAPTFNPKGAAAHASEPTDKIAAEAEASLWPYHSTRQIVTATEAQQRKNHNLTIIKAAIEKAYEQGREDEYQEWIRPNYPIRAAHAGAEKKLPPDWNKGLPVITHLSKPARASGQDESKAKRTARAIRSIAERAGLKITDDVELAWRDAILYALPAARASKVKQAMDAVPFGDEDEADQYHAAHAPTHCPYCNASFLPPNK